MEEFPTNDVGGFGTSGDPGAFGPGAADRYAALVEGPAGIPNEVLLRKVRGGGFSWCTFFFGPLYWAYRRCYAEAAVLALFNIVVGLLPESILWYVLGLATSAVLGAAFPFLYRWRADRLHGRALAQGAADERAAAAFVRERGGTSWLGVAAFLAAAFAIASVEVLALGLAAPAQTPPTTSAF